MQSASARAPEAVLRSERERGQLTELLRERRTQGASNGHTPGLGLDGLLYAVRRLDSGEGVAWLACGCGTRRGSFGISGLRTGVRRTLSAVAISCASDASATTNPPPGHSKSGEVQP